MRAFPSACHPSDEDLSPGTRFRGGRKTIDSSFHFKRPESWKVLKAFL
jgi:hypothetical protein